MFDIHYDQDADNPRDWDNLGTLAIKDPGGDEAPNPEFDLSNMIWLPVYRYEHSAVAYNTTGFHCPWDSGQTGYIYVSKGDIRREFGWTRISPSRRSKIEQYLREEVRTFSDWANGEVYGWINEETDDSCWGFYGSDHVASGLMESANEHR